MRFHVSLHQKNSGKKTCHVLRSGSFLGGMILKPFFKGPSSQVLWNQPKLVYGLSRSPCWRRFLPFGGFEFPEARRPTANWDT